jgi:hypothetical protein
VKEKKVKEQRRVKSVFTAGMWNVNSILMGGLGKDPEREGWYKCCFEVKIIE